LLCGLAWAGHGQNGSTHLVADVLHLLFSAVWPIGLLPLGMLLVRVSGGNVLEALVRRFSLLSIASVLLLTATGIINSCALVGSFSNLLTTPYGRVLLLKIAMFVMMVAIGAINLLYLKPRLMAQNGLPPFRQLQLNVTAEILLTAAVMGVVGLLGILEPGM
jgi:putative copper resistance protein D